MHHNKRTRTRSGSQFFISIFSALIVGVGLAYGGIFASQIASRPVAAHNESLSLSAFTEISEEISHEEDEEDPTFISRFSRGLMYSAEESVESEGESLTSVTNPSVSALAYSVQSLDKGNVLVEKDADRLLPIASVTKLITAVVAKKLLDEDTMIKITSRMLSTEGNTGKLRIGEKFKVKEILYPLLMVSSNDAAEALAQSYDATHGTGKFVKEMNAWASSIGAYRTYFRDPSGLSAHNVSTAHDISLIAQWIRDNEPDIFDITLTKSKSIRTRTWNNPTHFLNLSSYDGGKNGYTIEAKLTSVSLFSFGSPKRYYSVVILGSTRRDADTLAVLNKALK